MKYCIDTSFLINSWHKYNPQDLFPDMWPMLASMCENNEIIAPDEVVKELKIQDDDLYKWSKTQKSLQHPLDNELQKNLKLVLSRCETLVDIKRNRSRADPFVVALALQTGTSVVSYEEPRKRDSDPLKIPDACGILGVRYFDVPNFFRDLGWKFKIG